jgi:hypothetical protein
MTPEMISSEVEAACRDQTGRAVPHLTDFVPLAITQGVDGDADLAFIAIISNGHVQCGLVCGCSLMVGTRMRWSLTCYFDGDRERAEDALRSFRDQAAAELQQGTTFVSLLRGEKEGWRSFRRERLTSFPELLAHIRREHN